ncbi:tetratricopeptide repeat protein 7B [Eupeodes corollae]|uniref:tetratricopeptide repeat protein 7B n=1 Tax=Eupeodes corollae TaxID=290404 RepID=UPI0024914061|nr:tetratricopeptide repeat protein 7B [Eupeodes corollae]
MTGRLRNTVKVEALIENCRSEGKWQKVMELTEELKVGSPVNEHLANFLIGEAHLELYLEETSPTESNFAKARNCLQEAKKHLTLVTGENGQKAGIALDAYLLLAKLCYACGEYEKSLQNFVKAELNTLAEKELTLRSLKILAESYAIKGLCLENQISKPTSKFKKSERESEMINCFERATDLGLLYLQEQDVASLSSAVNATNVNSAGSAAGEPGRRMGAILEMALQRAPIVLIKAGKLQEAIERYRVMLNAIETRTTQSLRLTLSRQLAEVLLRGVSGTLYSPPFNTRRSRGNNQAKNMWKPRMYSHRIQFTPKNQHEETILLLLVAEALAVRDTVLSQSPEFRAARSHAMGNATAVYDLLTLAAVRWGLVYLLNESFEKALKFSFAESHVWRQYGLSLMSAGKHMHALRVLQESSKISPTDPFSCLMNSRLCYESLGLFQEGLKFAQQALRNEQKGYKNTRAQLYVGIGYQQLAIVSNMKSERDKYEKLATEALEKAVQADNNDHLGEYYLALQYALINNISEALVHVRNALSLRTEHAPSLHLFSLLLTASKRPREALEVVENALNEFPDNLNLLHVKAHLQLYLEDAETSLITVQRMLNIWREIYETQIAGLDNNELEKQSDTRSIVHVHISQMSDKDSNSIYATSLIPVNRVEQALSEAASSLSSFSPRMGNHKSWVIQLRMWLLLADVYLSIEQPNEALHCVQEAAQLNPQYYQIMFMRGQICIYLQQWADAKQCLINAVAANPNHTDALRVLGEIHHILGEPRLAEKVLKDATKLDPNCPKIWYSLGKVMDSLGDFAVSADCIAAALQLEPSCPVLPFTSMTLAFD